MCVRARVHMRAVWTLILDKMNAFTVPENWLYALVCLPHNHHSMIVHTYYNRHLLLHLCMWGL